MTSKIQLFKLALITGATSGLGEALADLLAKKKISLLLTGRNKARLETIASRYNATYFPFDLSKDRSHLLEWIRKHQPDLVINNAGFALYGPALLHPTSSQMEILEVNGAAAIEISLEAARLLHSQGKKGIILNISSSAGELPIPQMAVYAASKSLLTNFSQSFDAEMRPFGIRILASLPGPIATPFAERASKGKFKSNSILTADSAARLIWKQIVKKKGIQIIDFQTRTLFKLARFFPKRLINFVLSKSLSKRY